MLPPVLPRTGSVTLVFILKLDFMGKELALLTSSFELNEFVEVLEESLASPANTGLSTASVNLLEDGGLAGEEEIELLETVELELFKLGLKFFLRGGPDRARASPPPPNLALLLLGLELREQLSSDSSNFLFSALLALLGLANGIFLASLIGVPPDDNFSSVDSITRAVDDSGAGGDDDGPGELCGDDGAVLGNDDGGADPSDTCMLDLSSLACLSAIRDLNAAEYGLAEISRDFLAELPNITGPPYRS